MWRFHKDRKMPGQKGEKYGLHISQLWNSLNQQSLKKGKDEHKLLVFFY